MNDVTIDRTVYRILCFCLGWTIADMVSTIMGVNL